MIKKINEKILCQTESYANKISEVIVKDNYTPTLRKLPHKVKGKDVYTTKNSAIGKGIETVESEIIQRIAKQSIIDTFKLPAINRDKAISALIPILEDQSPKCIHRTDLSSFYESIPHNIIINKINQNRSIGQSTKNVVNSLLNQYKELSGKNKGLPRGVPLSATLAELCMVNIDETIKAMPEVNYYVRYVDDIIIVIKTKTSTNKSYDNVIQSITSTISEYNLSINSSKTETDYYSKERKVIEIEYLGYYFEEKNNNPLNIRMSIKKLFESTNKVQEFVADSTTKDLFDHDAESTRNVEQKKIDH